VFVTHEIDEAIKLGDRIAIMREGRLEQYDTPAAILARPASDLVVDLQGPDRGLKRLSVTPIDLGSLERPPIVHLSDSLEDARRAFDGTAVRALVLGVAVVDGNRVLGVLTPATFLKAIREVPAEREGAAAQPAQ